MDLLCVTFTAGAKLSQVKRDTAKADPTAKAFFMAAMGQPPFDVRDIVDLEGCRHIEFHAYAQEPTSACLIFYPGGEIATTSAILSGREPGADLDCLSRFQTSLDTAYKPNGVIPGREVFSITARPLLATEVWPNPSVSAADFARTGQLELAFAAAFLESATSSRRKRRR